MGKFLNKYRHEIILGILICIYITYFTIASFLRYDNYYAGRFDLGNMDQTVWNTVNGRIFQTSKTGGAVISRLSFHADFILILLSPFYFLWSSPKMLLLIQSVVLGIGGIFVYVLAKEILKSKNIALGLGLLFLSNPALHFTNLYDFHPVTLSTTLLLASFYFLMKRQHLLLVAFLILSGLTKEHIWVIVSIFGIALLCRKARLLGIGTILLSSLTFIYLIRYAIPQALGGQHFALGYYSDFGSSPASIITNVIFSPQQVFKTLFESSRLEYLMKLFLPLGFLPILSPLILAFSIPDLLIDLLSNNSQLRQIYYQYTASITPFIFISTIFTIKLFIKRFPKIPKYYFIIYLFTFSSISGYFFGPLPGARNPNIDMFTKPQTNRSLIEDTLSKIPEKYFVAATNNLGSHVAQRENLATIPLGVDKADILLFLLNDQSAQPSLTAQIKIVNDLKQNINYIKVVEKDDFVVFIKQGIML